ncbi:MAG: tetratricopeptide repeat protein [Anaerolineae bacterium]|nr:tetratricopeptide repeat protein [Anaerolineae bacterium]
MNKWIFTLIALLILIAPAMAQDENPANADEEAIECTAFEGNSDDVRVGYYMGEGDSYFRTGRYADAIRSYTCVIQIDRAYLDGYILRALSYIERRDYEEAIEDYDDALGLGQNIQLLNNRGIVYAALGNYERALADFDAALALDRDYLIAINNRGVIYAIQGDYDRAMTEFERAVALDPEYPQTHALIGMVHSYRALASYREYLRLAGNRADNRVQAAAASLESRFTFDLRFDDGTWLLEANLLADEDETTGGQ